MIWRFYAIKRPSGRFGEPFKAVNDEHAKYIVRDALDGAAGRLPDPHEFKLFCVGTWNAEDDQPIQVSTIEEVCSGEELYPNLEEVTKDGSV